jgi:hypothetical protein
VPIFFEKYIKIYGQKLLDLVKNKKHEKWIKASEILNK